MVCRVMRYFAAIGFAVMIGCATLTTAPVKAADGPGWSAAESIRSSKQFQRYMNRQAYRDWQRVRRLRQMRRARYQMRRRALQRRSGRTRQQVRRRAVRSRAVRSGRRTPQSRKSRKRAQVRARTRSRKTVRRQASRTTKPKRVVRKAGRQALFRPAGKSGSECRRGTVTIDCRNREIDIESGAQCNCPSGMELVYRGFGRLECKSSSCPTPENPARGGSGECGPGETRRSDGTCLLLVCPDGAPAIDGVCPCPRGTTFQKGACVGKVTQCWDGSAPDRQGRCPEPRCNLTEREECGDAAQRMPAQCANGARPVNGKCPIRVPGGLPRR